MEMIVERAYAKINLTLGVLYRRVDGYHALDSLMHTVDVYDTVTVERDSAVTVTASGATLPYNNTLRRAALSYQAYTGRGARVHVVKRIPSEAGMGGGSADAAALLRAMQRLYGELDRSALMDIALSVGADVPFAMEGGLARAEGVGELLTPLPDPTPFTFLVVKPEAGVSTRQLFLSLGLPRPLPRQAEAMAALARSDAAALGPLLFNALEEPASALVPEIPRIKRALLDAGALGASMTGSGSAVVGLFADGAAASAAVPALPENAFYRICHSVPRTDLL